MPIDLESALKQRKSETDKLTSGAYGYDPTASIGARTGGFLSKALSGVTQPSGALETAKTGVQSKLHRDIGRKYATQKLANERQKYNLISSTLVNRAIQAGYSYDQAVDYARQGVMKKLQQDFQAEQAEKERQAGVRSQDIKNEYASKGLEIESAYQPQTDYQAALTRALLGLGGDVGAYGMYKYASTPKDTTISGGNYIQPMQGVETPKNLDYRKY